MTRFMRALLLALAPLAAGAIKWCPAGQYRYTKCESRWCTFLCSCRTVEYCGACTAGQTSSGHTTNCARAERGQYLYKSGHTMGVGNCPAGQFQDRTNQYSCRSCGPGYYSPGARSASCTPCNAGDYQPNFGQSSCSPCAAGYISSSRSSTCTPCAPGRYEAGNACHECDAGKFSPEASTSCSLCDPGYYMQNYNDPANTNCLACPAGRFKTTAIVSQGLVDCEYCRGVNSDGTPAGFFDPNQRAMTSAEECECDEGFTGAKCDLASCPQTIALTSLGFLLLDVAWPAAARHLSRNEDFVGITAALQSADADGDAYLSEAECRAALAGKLSTETLPSHVWSKGGVEDGGRTKITGRVAISEMRDDVLARMQAQQSLEFYEHPLASGEITPMTATYPSPSTTASECADKNKKMPTVAWTINTNGGHLYRQCAYRNGINVGEEEGFNDDYTSGKEKDSSGKNCAYNAENRATTCGFSFTSTAQLSAPAKEIYCMENLYCSGACQKDANGTIANVDRALTVTRCATGAWYDGTPLDVIPILLGRQGVELSWLHTGIGDSVGISGFSIYKFDAAKQFLTDESRFLLREYGLKKAACGKTYQPIDFRDVTSGGTPAVQIGYGVVPLDQNGDEVTAKTGIARLLVPWLGNLRIKVRTESDSPVRDVAVSASRLLESGDIDPAYTDFVNCTTDTFGDCELAIRVKDVDWAAPRQYFRVNVSKTTLIPITERMVQEKDYNFTILPLSCAMVSAGFSDLTFWQKAFTPLDDRSFTIRQCAREVRTATWQTFPFGCGDFPWTDPCFDSYTGAVQGPAYGWRLTKRDALVRQDEENVRSAKLSFSYRTWFVGQASLKVVKKNAVGRVVSQEVVFTAPLAGQFFWPALIDLDVSQLDIGSDDEWVTLDIYSKVNTGPNPLWINDFIIHNAKLAVESDFPNKAPPKAVPHEFQPAVEDVGFLHLDDFELTFTDETAVSIRGVVKHSGFGENEFLDDECIRDKIDNKCICPVEEPRVRVVRASGATENVDVRPDGSYTTAIRLFETVTVKMERYNSSSSEGDPHTFKIVHDVDAGKIVDAQLEGVEPYLTFAADDGDMKINFIDTSKRDLSVALVTGAASNGTSASADYINGMPVVARVPRCFWRKTAFTMLGVASFGRLGATNVTVKMLDADEAEEQVFYGDGVAAVDDCDALNKSEVVYGNPRDGTGIMIRGCRVRIPSIAGTEKRPCATMTKPDGTPYKYVDELPIDRSAIADLSILDDNVTRRVELHLTSTLCVGEVSVRVDQAASIYTVGGRRETFMRPTEDWLLAPPQRDPNGPQPYGKACTDNFDAIVRDGDRYGLTFTLVELEPNCFANGLWPWDEGSGCVSTSPLKEVEPSAAFPITLSIEDLISGTEEPSVTYDGPYTHEMAIGPPNAFSPFTKEIDVKFTRAFDGAVIDYERHVMIVGTIPEEVPQIWTVATDNTLVYSVLRDPPGGLSTATLVEGSTISTSMSINGAHAAELATTFEWGVEAGYEADLSTGLGVTTEVLDFGTTAGFSYTHSAPDVSVERINSQEFNIAMSFSAAISTSDSPYVAGQPSDIIIGGGANLRFISSIEVYATEAANDVTCLQGRDTIQFLPETITTWVLSVYEIERLIDRLGGPLRNPNSTKISAVGNVSIPDLELQISNWETVLKNYRATTTRADLLSISEDLDQVLLDTSRHFNAFLALSKNGKDGSRSEFTDFLAKGIDKLNDDKLTKLGADAESDAGTSQPADLKEAGALDKLNADAAIDHDLAPALVRHATDVVTRVQKAGRACSEATKLADPGSDGSSLCDVYTRLTHQVKLTNHLFGVCSFHSTLPSHREFCKGGTVNNKKTAIFDALSDKTRFITFSGSTNVDFEWAVAEARGKEFSTSFDASESDSIGGDWRIGGSAGRRLAGYAYPADGPVHAVSKKLLEVTPEAIERRRLRTRSDAFSGEAEYMAKMAASSMSENAGRGGKDEMSDVLDSPCRRRLVSDSGSDGRRRLGVQGCVSFTGGDATAFSVNLARTGGKTQDHSRTVAVHLNDPQLQDTFAIRVASDPTYGMPIFTTLGGRSSCVGETGTTKRDSRISILDIVPTCADGECKDLPLDQVATFNVVLENLSPWKTSVKYLLRATKGGSSPWFAGKTVGETCPDGDMGALAIEPVSLVNLNLRDGEGMIIAPLEYGQHEVHLKITRDSDLSPQCYAYKDIELELVSICEDNDWDENQETYQYRTSKMDPITGDFDVVHPIWDNTTYSFKKDTMALGASTSRKKFSVSWSDKVPGCTYAEASNYDPTATVSDLSCTFAVKGCPYAAATNYDARATVDDGSCKFGANFAPTEGVGYVCFAQSQTPGAVQLLKEAIAALTGVATSQINIEEGPTDGSSCGKAANRRRLEQASAYRYTFKTNDEVGDVTLDKLSAQWTGDEIVGVGGTTTSLLLPTPAPTVTSMPTPPNAGCTYAVANNYDPLATIDDGSCKFPDDPGCTYAEAANYNPKATKDDGSCVFTREPSREPTSAPTPLAFPNCGVRVVRGNDPADFYCETNPDATRHNDLGIAFACCDLDGISTCDRHERGNGNSACNAGRWNTEGFTPRNWLGAMKYCGAGRTLCDVPQPCKSGGCAYDKIYQWTGEECQPGDANYPAWCVPTPTPTSSPTAIPTAGPTALPTASPTSAPTASPTAGPTVLPTPVPTATPTAGPTSRPTPVPTVTPVPIPVPTPAPTLGPTLSPTVTAAPTVAPSPDPTGAPTAGPSPAPSSTPTSDPSSAPTSAPTASSAPTSAWTCPAGTFWNREGQCEACDKLHEECKDCECDDFTGEFAAVADNCKAACL